MPVHAEVQRSVARLRPMAPYVQDVRLFSCATTTTSTADVVFGEASLQFVLVRSATLRWRLAYETPRWWTRCQYIGKCFEIPPIVPEAESGGFPIFAAGYQLLPTSSSLHTIAASR